MKILTNIIDTNKILKLTQGQDHKVKGQNQIFNFIEEIVSTVYYEPMVVYWCYSQIWLIIIGCWC